MKLILLCVWTEQAVLGSAKTALKLKHEIEIAYHIHKSMYGAEAAWKVKEITHDLNHDLTFYCIHNQLSVPQYKVNV